MLLNYKNTFLLACVFVLAPKILFDVLVVHRSRSSEEDMMTAHSTMLMT